MPRNRFEAVSLGTDITTGDPNPPSRYRSPKMDSNISGPSNDEVDHSRERHEPDPTSRFLFVNETNDAPPYKVGYRHDIRSHVRKQASKRKTRLKKEKMESKLKSLVPQAAEQVASENLIEQKHSPSTLTTLPPVYTPSFKSKDSPGLINCLPYRSPSSASDWPTATDRKAPTIEFITDPTATALPKATVPHYHGGHASSYKPYGEKPNNLKPNEKAQRQTGSMILKPQRSKKPSPLSPHSILGSGRVDPFSSYPVENPDQALHELMDFVVTYSIPGLRPDDTPEPGLVSSSRANTVSKAWYAASLKTPLLFHALAFSGLIHRDYLRYSQIYPDSPQALSHKLLAIQGINDVIGDGSEFSKSDEVILSILILATHETLKATEEKRKPFNSPLKRAQWLNVYGNIKYVAEHRKAVWDLLILRGGLETLKLPGLAETIVGGDIMTALNGFTKPALPPLHENYIAAVKVWAARYRNPVQTLTSAFWDLRDYGITDAMLQVLDAMGALTLAIDHYLQAKPGGLTLGQLARTRTAIEKRLLMLPSAAELNTTIETEPNIYECCRLTAMIFGVAVVLPIPNTYDVLQIYVTHLKAAIECAGLETLCSRNTALSGLFLWMLILGGIGALEKPERRWFVSQLALLIDKLKINWVSVEEILQTFLWLDSACSPGGRDLWAKVEDIAL